MIKKWSCLLLLLLPALMLLAQPDVKLKRKDYTKDVKLVTDKGDIILRLSDSTPLHRDNFLKLAKAKYYNGILFHRVIKGFMAQAGDAATKKSKDTSSRQWAGYTIPAEIIPSLYHKKGALAAARMGDNVNPERRSSGVQFYIVQGRTFTDAQLDSIQTARLQGRQIPEERRQLYKTVGGTPQLDGNYTVFGEVVKGLDVLDAIANVPTSKQPPDKPLTDLRIKKVKLVKRKAR
ncbi:MAG: peptidylprolyl isomerase [Chitinophagaceae bacterium]